MKKIFLIIIVNCLIGSCKKDHLKNEQEILIGKWRWVNTVHKFGWCEGLGTIVELITPETEGSNYLMELRKSGHVDFYNDEKLISKNRIVCEHFKIFENGNFEFVYLINNKQDSKLAGYGWPEDSLVITEYPLNGISGCEDYLNYFIRE